MADAPQNMHPQLAQLILSLQMGAMQQMGKIASPLTGKVERDLMMAQASIDMLSMLQEKMKGNLTDEEDKFLGHVLYELRMNYVDEAKKPDEKSEEESRETSGGQPSEQPQPGDDEPAKKEPGSDE